MRGNAPKKRLRRASPEARSTPPARRRHDDGLRHNRRFERSLRPQFAVDRDAHARLRIDPHPLSPELPHRLVTRRVLEHARGIAPPELHDAASLYRLDDDLTAF